MAADKKKKKQILGRYPIWQEEGYLFSSLAKLGTLLLLAELGTLLLERVGHGGWLIGHKLFQPEAYPTCVSSKLYEFIPFHSLLLLTNSLFPG